MSLVAKLNAAFEAIGVAIKTVRTRLTVLESNVISAGAVKVTLANLAINTPKDFTITFLKPFSNDAYAYTEPLITNLSGLAITAFTVSYKSKTANQIVFTVTNTTVPLLSGSFVIYVTAQGK